jgi:hypothetical protein
MRATYTVHLIFLDLITLMDKNVPHKKSLDFGIIFWVSAYDVLGGGYHIASNLLDSS